jgi:hypothetical protein
MRSFERLSFPDKWRVNRLLARGKGPDDTRTAAAAVELAESYQRQGRSHRAIVLFAFVIMATGFTFIGVAAVGSGEAELSILCALIVVASVVQLAFSPTIRPRKVAQSLEAARRVVATSRH